MGRNRKSARTVEQITAPAAVVPPVTQTVSGDYTDTTIFNPEMLPAPLQAYLKKAHDDNIRFVKSKNDFFADLMQKDMRNLGLNPDSDDDVRLYTDLCSWGPDGKMSWIPTDEEFQEIKRKHPNIQREADGSVLYSTDSMRYTRANAKSYSIINSRFKTIGGSPPGIGYLMIARQLAAARKLVDRTGKNVIIRVNAVNERNQMNGFYTWPKLGYVFSIPPEMKNELQRLGFTEKQMKNSATLMLSTNPSGQTGFDVWADVVRITGLGPYGRGLGRVTVTPKSARATNAKQYSLAEQVTREYGKRKGFVKRISSSAASSSAQFNNFFSNDDAQDNAILRDIWHDLAKKYKG